MRRFDVESMGRMSMQSQAGLSLLTTPAVHPPQSRKKGASMTEKPVQMWSSRIMSWGPREKWEGRDDDAEERLEWKVYVLRAREVEKVQPRSDGGTRAKQMKAAVSERGPRDAQGWQK